MSTTPATSAYDLILGLHIIAVVIAFGWTFTLPVVYAVAARQDPRSLPILHRIECRVSQIILNPALVVILGAGIFLASDGHHWSEFFVQWGLGVVVVIGGVVGVELIPAARRAQAAVAKDLESYTGGDFEPGPEYRAIVRRLNTVGGAISVLVLVTIVIMAIKP